MANNQAARRDALGQAMWDLMRNRPGARESAEALVAGGALDQAFVTKFIRTVAGLTLRAGREE